MKIPNKEIAEEIFICWKDGNREWDMVIRKSEVLINTLNTRLYHFSSRLERDERDLPSVKKFRRPNCSEISLGSKHIYPEGSAIIE